MAKKIEQKFLTEFKKSMEEAAALNEVPFFWYKIPDQPHIGTMRFDSPKPFDAICISNGNALAIEAKAFDKWKAFSLRDIRDSQIEGLTKFDEAGGASIVLLNVRIAADKAKEIKYENRLYVFNWRGLHYRLQDSSITAKELREELPYIEGSKGRFDVSLIADSVCFEID